jgi:hypothetical protein
MCGNEARSQTAAGAVEAPAAAMSVGCRRCAPAQALGHAKTCIALAAVLLLALGALKTATGRSRAA